MKRSTALAAPGAVWVLAGSAQAQGEPSRLDDAAESAHATAGTSLLDIVGLQLDIADAFGVKVDLCTERELHPVLRARILAEPRPL